MRRSTAGAGRWSSTATQCSVPRSRSPTAFAPISGPCPASAGHRDGRKLNGGIMTETGTGAGPAQIGHRVLGIYLNDHLAGATAGAELAHRMARTHQAQGQDD